MKNMSLSVHFIFLNLNDVWSGEQHALFHVRKSI